MAKSEKINSNSKNIELRWDFPSTNHGEESGFADPLIEYFQGDHEKYVARETIQNAVDARDNYSEPVVIVFERIEIAVAKMPEWKILEPYMARCMEHEKDQEKSERFFKNAIELLNKSKIHVLKISDFNTKGLTGTDLDTKGNWYRLVRAAGTSSPKGPAGGSFGIGKGAPFAASSLRTVFYSSVNDKGECVFQGKSRLVSHHDEDKDVRQAVGFYGIDGYKAVRTKSAIPEFYRRDPQGTDVFVVGYNSDDAWQIKLIKSVLSNFWLAIFSGDLVVVFKGNDEKTISRSNLKKYLEDYDVEDALAYYESVTQWTQEFKQDLKHLGKTSLFVRKQDGYPSKIMMARKPKMLVQEKQYRVLREPYAGVFICEDDRGNELLRDMEPPAHNEWDKGRAANIENGLAALRELDEFIKSSLRGMGEAITSEPQDIPGLDRYLPDSEDRESATRNEYGATEPTDLSTQEESGREIGGSRELTPLEIKNVIRRGVVTSRQAGGVVVTPPEGAGGEGRGRPTGREAGEREGIRIKTSNISFRSYVQKQKEGYEYHFVIRGKNNCEGGIRLVAVGDDNNYLVNIESAKDVESGKMYEINGSMILGLVIKAEQVVRIIVKLASHKRYALGIETYES